jgi:hypothetical protein
MERPLRPTSANVISHVLNRANARRTLLEDGRKKGIEVIYSVVEQREKHDANKTAATKYVPRQQ